ncbi:MAG: hypothetical protein Q8O67_30400 [Deltaproteobacteria bacterium]|nr:hypothetical protein [Deltaproteobacteria bacterium]
MSLLERSFDAALSADCSPDRCFSKGCVYARHQTIDLPRGTSLPGLPSEESLGSVAPQEYLTEARCEFTHERTVATADIQALVRRLEQRLSRGWLKVVVAPQVLEPVSKSLAEPIKRKEPVEDKPKPVEPEKPPETPPPTTTTTTPAAPEELSAPAALRELWLSLLPHFPWMVAIFLLTLATAALIWAARRLGAPSIEERMLEAQMTAPEPPPSTEPLPAEVEARKLSQEEEKTFAEQQERMWVDRISHVESSDDEMVSELLKEWLKAGDFPMLGRALFIFGDRLSHAFSTDGELALKKLEFAEFFRDVDESTLPSRAEFFRRLNQHAMSSLLLSQDDVQLYRSLREDFGSSGVHALMQSLPTRFAALFFALVPRDSQVDVARLMTPQMRAAVAEQLLASTRISKEESAFLFACIGAARDGRALPEPPKPGVTDRGPSVDAAAALSVLLPLMAVEERPALFARALHGNASAPLWFEDIFFGEMIMKLPNELRRDLLLDVDIRALAAWLGLQDVDWQRTFAAQLSASMQNALRGNAGFSSRAEQLRLARRGHQDIVKALKSQYAKGRASFLDLVA